MFHGGGRNTNNGLSTIYSGDEQEGLARGGNHPSSSENKKKISRKSSRNRMGTRTDETTPLTTSSRNKRKQPKEKTLREKVIAFASIGTSIAAVVLGAVVLFTAFFGGRFKGHMRNRTGSHYSGGDETAQFYDDMDRFVMEDYDQKPPFSDFLPALAGYYGKPLYAFYVNRGQGIASFGTESKDYPMMEFNPANKAYQMTPFVGFRTFIQGSRRNRPFLVEPFSPLQTRYSDQDTKFPRRTMFIGTNEMQLQEVDAETQLETNVTYIILPEEDFGAFVRRVTITNIGRHEVSLSLLDGLAKMEPAGGKMNGLLKDIGRTLEGFMGVYSPYDDTYDMPFYRLSTQPADTAAVVVQQAGHWCLSVKEDGDTTTLLPIIYDTTKVFGDDTTLLQPVKLRSKTIRDIVDGPQYGKAKTPSAFAAATDVNLRAGQSLTFTTYFGRAEDILDVPVIARRLLQSGFSEYKVSRSREIIQQITAGVVTMTSSKLFNAHVGQMYLDNSLRGGVPSILGDVDDDAMMRNADEDSRLKVYHLFSRIHGDLERDYNNFVIMPTFFSEGPGNFRDVAQNRRNDVLFQPRIGSYNVRSFISYLQADGYNPLTVEAPSFTISHLKTCEQIATAAVGEADGHRAQRETLTGLLNAGPFRPGQLFQLMEDLNVQLIISRQDFIDLVAASSETNPMANYTKGFWADHWTYIVDLIHGWLAVYPDWEGRILFDTRLPYFFSPAFVKPRSKKYVLSPTFDGLSKHVRQLDATEDKDLDKFAYMDKFIDSQSGWYELEANWQHTKDGKIFLSSPMAKLLVLATVKFATRDPYGMGIEYEGGRPGWDDANNGLVGMIGSGMPEAIELNALLRLIRSTVSKFAGDLDIPIEAAELMDEIMEALTALRTSNPVMPDYDDDTGDVGLRVPSHLFRYWDKVASAREAYREKIKVTFDGRTQTLANQEIQSMVSVWIDEIDAGIERARAFGTQGKDDSGNFDVTPTYFSYNAVHWTHNGLETNTGLPLVNVTAMEVRVFPMFLEGPARMMKLLDPNEADDLYRKVRESPLRDEGLGMYTISASLKGQSFDLGREMAFAPGWLENQSVWMHMSYKFYLELIRHDLLDEFFGELHDGGILPFVNAEKYGRSLLECSSFIASSVFEDPDMRGRGFLARLSGSTAEFLSMWTLMMIGPNPFTLGRNGILRFQLLPALPRWLFNDDDDGENSWVSFKLFGAIEVTYHHHRGAENLYRIPPTRYVVGFGDGQTINADGPYVEADIADKIRRVVFVTTIDVYFEP